MKLRTWSGAGNLFFEPTPKYVGGFMTPTDMFSHEIYDESHKYYLIYRYPIRKYSDSISNYCRISPDDISAIELS